MCVEKIQKILLASALGMVLMFWGIQAVKLAFMLQFIIMVILLMSATTNFCYLTKLLKQAFPSCNENEENK